jgi:hypothetical protein
LAVTPFYFVFYSANIHATIQYHRLTKPSPGLVSCHSLGILTLLNI